MLPTPEEGLQVLGATIRAARTARGLTQQRAAKEAKISRAQLALLEQGGNVSIKFLLKIARFLGLSEIPLDGTVKITTGEGALNVFEILRTLEVVGALVEHVKAAAIHAVLPADEAKLQDTPALKEFVARHAGDEQGLERLLDAMLPLSNEVRPSTAPRPVDAVPARTRRRRAGERK